MSMLTMFDVANMLIEIQDIKAENAYHEERGQLGVEVEPFEMLEMTQNAAVVPEEAIRETVLQMKQRWAFDKPCDDAVLETGARYALAVGKKIEERGYSAVTLIDVDGMKKAIGALNSKIQAFDASCFDGVYVTGDITSGDIERLNEKRRGGEENQEDTSRLALPNPEV